MSDLTQEPGLTERLAAKLEAEGFVQFDAVLIGHKAHTVLPLLLSEPELVAGLAPEVKREVLSALLRERLEEFGAAVAMPNGYQTYGNGAPVHTPVKVEDVLAILAPSVPRG